MIDLHTHLDLYPNSLDILPRVNKENQFTLAVTTSPRAWKATSKVFEKYENIKVALGLHPEVANLKFNELELLLSLIEKVNFIGEIGLDGSEKYLAVKDKQELIFDRVISECQKVGGRIISIHSRGAAFKTLSIIKKYPNCGIPILHWFSGTMTELEEAIDMNCFFSINPVMLESKKGRILASAIPPEKILPESDGPFANLNGRPVMPWEAMNVCSVLSSVWGISYEDAEGRIVDNCKKIVNF